VNPSSLLNVVVHKHSRKKPKNSAERETFFFEIFSPLLAH